MKKDFDGKINFFKKKQLYLIEKAGEKMQFYLYFFIFAIHSGEWLSEDLIFRDFCIT